MRSFGLVFGNTTDGVAQVLAISAPGRDASPRAGYRSPPAREIRVFEALIAAFEEARTRGIRSVAVQPLGTTHAGLDPERFLKLLARVCYSSAELTTTVRRVVG